MGQQHRRKNDGGEVAASGPEGRQARRRRRLALGATFVATGTAQAADFTVTNTDQTGPGSLRDAIDQANAAATSAAPTASSSSRE